MYKTGLVLSGGGARGIAHLGILQALDDFDVKVDVISGCSVGAIIGALYAADYPVRDIINIIAESKILGRRHLSIRKAGLFNMRFFEELNQTYLPGNKFELLSIPLIVTATDIDKGEIRYFSSGDLSKCLMASACIPVIFHPIRYMGMTLVDGGVLNNFPIEPLLGNCSNIIGVHVNSINKSVPASNMNDILDRSFHLALSSDVSQKSQHCQLFFEPPNMSQYAMFDTKSVHKIFEYSYEYASGMLENSVLNKRQPV